MMARYSFSRTLSYDLISGLVVFLVALPLCLGIALASNAPLFSGILAGIVGGIIVGAFSGSSTSVSGPAAGLTAVVAAQIHHLGTFEAFLAAVVIAGVIQIILSISQLGFIAAFFPSSVIKGLLWAIGVILVLKQIPHLLGHDADPIGNKSFMQANNQNTFSGIFETFFDMHPGAALIGILSIFLLVFWDKFQVLKNSQIPAPLVVIVLSVIASLFLRQYGGYWMLDSSHLVQVPVVDPANNAFAFFTFPDWSILKNSSVYVAAMTIALVASLETLLNLEAVDKIDPLQRISPPNRELFAQGMGNVVAGLIGALPVTSVIVRSSVNINAGARTKLSAIWHGFLILASVILIPNWLNQIPLSALAAILLITGLKLASPKLLMQMWREGKNQFLPFIITVSAIVFTDLLMGVLIGLGISICFILHSNIRRPIKKVIEKHATGDEVLHIELPNQVSFFNRASLENTLKNIPAGGHVLIDANNTDYIDPDILDLLTDFQNTTATTRKVAVSLIGFKNKYPQLEDRIRYVDVSSPEMQKNLTPDRILEILQEGNLRFREGTRLTRDLDRQLNVTSRGQFPMAVVLSCIDSRSPVELIFDLSLGDIFSVRIAGNVVSPKVLGSIEYSCAVAGAKLILVMGHTSCGAVKASVDFVCKQQTAAEATGCMNLDSLIMEIQKSIDVNDCKGFAHWSPEQKENYFNEIAYKNVLQTMQEIRKNSSTLDALIRQRKIALVGAMYDISTAEVSFFQASEPDSFLCLRQQENQS
ncbi:bifunctional SulP family inorganic anion transporter/carbonic anhydrase [Parachlamydia sp. AcF125]|uniref:bifunctional SulP family inorganic anion transporter/carbonic anhydrase n=1 Tax=Parachlamydia sp. AcF125 TaxID=2795736 RepID=UPI001BC98736|nr:bifunctional SulP family inorganic anion transporter/carbonic anhydrase [Parachlamydia sp. AcF125]MBS4168722.1 C4-dicarboxylic acid transporter DauA [Parachlamydia sp. AcF125]